MEANFSLKEITDYGRLGHFQKTQMGISLRKKTPYSIRDLQKMKTPNPNKRHSLWYTWHSMKQRCLNSKNKDYKNYGGRGIKISNELLTFKGFLYVVEADLGPKPTKKVQLDRIDSEGNYERGNLRWASPYQQAINKRNSLKIKGVTVSTTLLAQKYELNRDSIIQLIKQGWNENGIKFYSNLDFKKKKKLGALSNELTQNEAFEKFLGITK